MSELGLTSSAEPAIAAQSSVKWIDVETAAARAGMNAGVIRRMCAEQFMATGMARVQQQPGARSKWFVREDADARFARVKFPEQLSNEFRAKVMPTLTDAQRATIIRRRQILSDWQSAISSAMKLGMSRDAATDRFVGQYRLGGEKLSRGTLYNWHARWRREGDGGLVDQRGGKNEVGGFDHFLTYAAAIYLDPRKRSMRLCFDCAEARAEESGWATPSYKTLQRHLKGLPADLVCRKREGDSAFVAKIEPYVDRDYSSIESNGWWCSDHHRLDAMIVAGVDARGKPRFVRPWLHAWQDLRSRMIVGWSIVSHDCNSDLILSTVTAAMRAHGVPGRVYVDNGDDFGARVLEGTTKQQRRRKVKLDEASVKRIGGAFAMLGIPVTHAWPYHGQSKPIERWFGSVAARFAKLLDTYCGNSPATKPENLQRQLDAGKALTLAELREAFAAWLEADHQHKIHGGDSMEERTPTQVHAACLGTRRTIAEELLEFATLPRTKAVKVRQNGVTHDGLMFGRAEQELQRRIGKSVILAVPQSLDHVLVLNTDGSLICRASVNSRLPFGATKQQMREVGAEKKRARQLVRDASVARPKLTEDPTQALWRRKIRADRELPTPSLSPVRTPVDDQFSAIQKAMPSASAMRRHVADLAELDDLRPTQLRIAGSDDSGGDEEVFDSISEAMRSVREASA